MQCKGCSAVIMPGMVHGCSPVVQSLPPVAYIERNGAGIEKSKLHQSTGRPKGVKGVNARHPSAIAIAFKKHGLDWQKDMAVSIMQHDKERIAMWLKLLPYLVTSANKHKVKRWKGKASKAALEALKALENE